MSFIDELKTRKDLLINPQGLVAVAGCSLDAISQRFRGNPQYQLDIREAEQRKYLAQSSCISRN